FQITPLTVLPFSDAPAALNKVEAEDMRASVTCDAPFYAWATVTDGSARQAVFVTPARGNSTLQPPGSEASCSPAADICFERAGLFHRPVPGDPEEKMLLPVPPGEYRSIRVSFDAMNGGPLGYRGTRYVEQLMFWLAVRGDRQRYGFVRLRNIGPDYELNVSHGVGTRFEDKIVHRTGLFFPFGAVYHWDYLYDAENRSLILTVTDQAGNTVARVEGIPNVDRITRPEGWDFHLNFGYGKRPNDNEYRSLGWEFSNLVVEVYE
ncbi:MAG: hypothetical protein R3234_07375, partial [Thermoanaerobaculia bacterium]|nr:hypothetical protein [Thermoanaerobaculia bacterium]